MLRKKNGIRVNLYEFMSESFMNISGFISKSFMNVKFNFY